MILSYSRIGLIGFLAILVWFMVDAANAVSKKLSERKMNKDPKSSRTQRVLITDPLIAILLAGFFILIYLLSFQDNRIKKFLNFISSDSYYQTNTISLITLAKK